MTASDLERVRESLLSRERSTLGDLHDDTGLESSELIPILARLRATRVDVISSRIPLARSEFYLERP